MIQPCDSPIHRKPRPSLIDAWNDLDVAKLASVANRWTKVLKIICHSRGDNVKSDAFRGKAIVSEVDLDTLEAEMAGNTEDDIVEEETELVLDD